MSIAPDFDSMYAADPDPWEVATSWYERRKIDIALASLRRQRYRFAWDAACGTGELASHLAGRCERVLATDMSAVAVSLSTRRLQPLPQVSVTQSHLPSKPTALEERPDLIVLSEVMYYLPPADRAATYALVDEVAAPEADLLLVNWAPQPEDAYASGLAVFNEANDTLNALGWGRLVTHTDIEFVLGCWSRDLPETIGR
ncbi:methyltransferase domain-containing protein [Gephyromycinifex aptenodytis]|uniref:methyltransferase domain-containing protein n=1 Tax=Gephyromycinifex aptenodytis TaxID=2716227 RepID=UPI001D0063E8|nr:class I SAM-dependent methyltransferase [Gephyromycinifex aptenodytis]